jgi:LysR family transcriptional regulator, nitrogen assimilation regulatory protein
VEADTFSTLKDLVANGHGWTVLPLAAIHRDLRARTLTAAPLIEPAPVRRLVLSFPTDRLASRLARFAGETIKDVIVEHVDRGIWAGKLLDGQAIDL